MPSPQGSKDRSVALRSSWKLSASKSIRASLGWQFVKHTRSKQKPEIVTNTPRMRDRIPSFMQSVEQREALVWSCLFLYPELKQTMIRMIIDRQAIDRLEPNANVKEVGAVVVMKPSEPPPWNCAEFVIWSFKAQRLPWASEWPPGSRGTLRGLVGSICFSFLSFLNTL